MDIPSDYFFTGGIPTKNVDLAPSILFLILYILLSVLLIYRWVRPQDRTLILIRPTIFILARITLFIIRIVLCEQGESEGLMIADLVLILVGFLMIIEPAIEMWKNLVAETVWREKGCPPPGMDSSRDRRGLRARHWTDSVALLLRLALLGAIVTGIVAGVKSSDAFTSTSAASLVNGMRKACYILSMVIAGVLFLAEIVTYIRMPHLDRIASLYLFAITALLCVVASYRLATSTANNSAWVRSKTAFYILQIAIEFIACTMILAISIPQWYPKHVASPPQHNMMMPQESYGNSPTGSQQRMMPKAESYGRETV